MQFLIAVTLFVAPYFAIFYMINDFTNHYSYVLRIHGKSLEDMYFLGCAETGFPNLSECRSNAKNHIARATNIVRNK